MTNNNNNRRGFFQKLFGFGTVAVIAPKVLAKANEVPPVINNLPPKPPVPVKSLYSDCYAFSGSYYATGRADFIPLSGSFNTAFK
jgi:hypothetical protein